MNTVHPFPAAAFDGKRNGELNSNSSTVLHTPEQERRDIPSQPIIWKGGELPSPTTFVSSSSTSSSVPYLTSESSDSGTSFGHDFWQDESPIKSQSAEVAASNEDQGVIGLTVQQEVADQWQSDCDLSECPVKTVEEEEEEIRQLQGKIRDIRRQRSALWSNGLELVRQRKALLLQHLNNAELLRDNIMASLESTATQMVKVSSALESTRHFDATSDCFHIRNHGPIGTINGLRLGADAAAAVAAVVVPSADIMQVNDGTFLNGTHATKENNNEGNSSTSIFVSMLKNPQYIFTPMPTSTDTSKVPWTEINGALGMAALLLLVLRDRSNSTIVFRTHDILPMGHRTKIAEVKKKKSKGGTSSDELPLAVHDLFYDGDAGGWNMLLFGRSNFNAALHGLACCLADAADCVQSSDAAAILPHDIVRAGSKQKGANETTIGGLPVAYKADREKWSRAMKYMLLDLKCLSTFVAKRTTR